MTSDELNELKLDIYKLYGKNRGKKVMDVYRRMLMLIEHAQQLQVTLRTIREIGSRHTL
jgi:hypothetical protein